MSEVKDKLINIAMNTIQKSGINSLTMRELGDAVGIKSSSVMYHFKNKDGLIEILLQTYSDFFFNYLDELNRTYSDKKQRLDKFVDIFEGVLNEDKFCLCGMLAAENESLDERTSQNTQNFFQEAQKWISANLQNQTNADEMAMIIISSLEGALLLDKLDASTARIKAVRTWIKSL